MAAYHLNAGQTKSVPLPGNPTVVTEVTAVNNGPGPIKVQFHNFSPVPGTMNVGPNTSDTKRGSWNVSGQAGIILTETGGVDHSDGRIEWTDDTGGSSSGSGSG